MPSDQTDYRGTIAITTSGRTCQRWDDQSPHSHPPLHITYPNAGLDENYCRNPDGEDGAWCYTTDVDVRWELCTVPSCDEDEDGSSTSGDDTDEDVSKVSGGMQSLIRLSFADVLLVYSNALGYA